MITHDCVVTPAKGSYVNDVDPWKYSLIFF